MNQKETGMVLSLMVAWWPEFKYGGEVTIKAWSQLFAENRVTLSEARAALSHLVKTGNQYPPNAPAVIQAVQVIRAANSQHRPLTTEERWAKLLDWSAAHKTATWVQSKCTGRTWSAIRAAGGWEGIGRADKDTALPFVRKAFIDAYNSMKNADEAHDSAQTAIEHAETLRLVQSTAKKLEAK